jgi:1,4-alpha-glucan branching enzyme
MYSRGKKKGVVRFAVKPRGSPGKVLVAGDFNGWRPAPMRKQKDGTFVRNAVVATETFEYKFIIDGQWTTDPDNSDWTLNPYGTFNSAARLE